MKESYNQQLQQEMLDEYLKPKTIPIIGWNNEYPKIISDVNVIDTTGKSFTLTLPAPSNGRTITINKLVDKMPFIPLDQSDEYIKMMQEQIDKLQNSIIESQKLIGEPKIIVSKICNHSWKSYKGLLEAYDYCEKCDQKR